MLEDRSPLDPGWTAGRYGTIGPDGPGVHIRRIKGMHMVQLVGWPEDFAGVTSRLQAIVGCPAPERYGLAANRGEVTVFWPGPERLWIATPEAAVVGTLEDAIAADQVFSTNLTDSRSMLRIWGPKTRTTLAKGLPVDLHPRAFPVNGAALSAIHHVDVLVHLRDTQDRTTFDLYLPQAVARSFWEWMSEAAAEFGFETID